MTSAKTQAPRIRSKFLDPDLRPTPKTDRFCLICSQDLRTDRPARTVKYALEVYEAVHPDDWQRIEQAPWPIENGLLGPDCAKAFGLEWSEPEKDKT